MGAGIGDDGLTEPAVLLGTRSRGLTLLEGEKNRGAPPDQILVEVTHDGLAASSWVYEYPDFGHLVAFLSDLERDWRGWEGERNWSSLEGELTIRAEHLGGRVELRIELHRESWTVTTQTVVGAGEDLSSAARTAERWLS